jgi:K+ transporter
MTSMRLVRARAAAVESSRATARPRWIVPFFAGAALLLVPWIVVLAISLPSSHRAAHWGLAWTGFDIVLTLLLVAVAVSAWRCSAWLEGAATAAAVLLLVDAWFDVLTAATRSELVVALLEAAFVELPTAAVCILLARGVERRLQTSMEPT